VTKGDHAQYNGADWFMSDSTHSVTQKARSSLDNFEIAV
jgi:hypothetical protein